MMKIWTSHQLGFSLMPRSRFSWLKWCIVTTKRAVANLPLSHLVSLGRTSVRPQQYRSERSVTAAAVRNAADEDFQAQRKMKLIVAKFAMIKTLTDSISIQLRL
jgi:hypothetical protein